jgi:hypothetical protein
VHKHVLAAVVGLNESKSLSCIEPLYSACRHVRTPLFNNGDNLGRSSSRPQEKARQAEPGGLRHLGAQVRTGPDEAV